MLCAVGSRFAVEDVGVHVFVTVARAWYRRPPQLCTAEEVHIFAM